jgi:hypothetical protein
MTKQDHRLLGWEPFAGEISGILKKHGFYILARSIEKLESPDHEIQSALREVLLRRQIPYIPLTFGDGAVDFEYFMNSFGVSREFSHSHAEIVEFEKSLPDGVELFHVYWLERSYHEGPGWVAYVQTEKYGGIFEEYFKIPGRAKVA